MLALGLNSGSSFDGIDAVLVDIPLAPDGQLARPRFIAGTTAQWPDKVAQQVLAAFDIGHGLNRYLILLPPEGPVRGDEFLLDLGEGAVDRDRLLAGAEDGAEERLIVGFSAARR